MWLHISPFLQVTPCQVAPCQVTPGQVTSDQVTPCQVTHGQVTPDQVTPCQVTPGQVTPCQVTLDQVTHPHSDTSPAGVLAPRLQVPYHLTSSFIMRMAESYTISTVVKMIYQARAKRVRGARAFHELRRYHTRPLRLNWGPENVHFGKMHFRDLNINARIFKNYQA